jgi:lysophospholipase L1-like esterase
MVTEEIDLKKTGDATRPGLLTLVLMGDSITFGQCVEPEYRWAHSVTDRLLRMYLDTPINIHVMNRGISGETSRQGLERFPVDVQDAHPDIMTLQFGLNDCNCWLTDRGLPRVSESAFRANLIEMISRARLFGARHIILSNNHRTVRHKMMLSGERYEDANARYSGIIEEVATETGVTFCDIRKAFEPFSEPELEDLLIPYPDQLHLSASGNRVYEKAIWPFIHEAVEDLIKERFREEVYEKQY